MEDNEKKNPEEEVKETSETEEKQEEKEVEVPVEDAPAEEETVEEMPDNSEIEQLRAENLQLKTQLEAMKTGFTAEYIEDAVALAESTAKRDNIDIKKALENIAKKYPEWKSENKTKGGFKVGADSKESSFNADESRLADAFNLKKKRKD